MTTPRSATAAAQDPDTPPQRLVELTSEHPELQELIVMNPSCPDVARHWILATNPAAKQLYETDAAVGDTARTPAVTQHDPAPQPAPELDPQAVSVWGDLLTPSAPPTAGARPAVPDAAASTAGVRVVSDGVVPLGPATPAADGPGLTPIAEAQAPSPSHSSPIPPAAAIPSGPSSAADAQGPPPAAEDSGDDGSGRRRGVWFACGGCLLLVILLAVAALVVGLIWLGGDDDDYQRPGPSVGASESPETAATEPAEPSEDPVSPAPEGAVELDAVQSPTGNIRCSLEGDAVGCSVLKTEFPQDGPEGCSTDAFSYRLAGGEAATACGTTFGTESAQTLEYGESAVSGDVACTSEFDGMTCWNTRTGKGFMVNRVTYESF